MVKNQSKVDWWYTYHNSWQSSWFNSYSEDLEPLFLAEIVIFCYFWPIFEALQVQMDDLTDEKWFRWHQTHPYHSLSQSRWLIWDFMDLEPLFLAEIVIFCYFWPIFEALQVQMDDLTDEKWFRWHQTHPYHSLSQSRWLIWDFMDLGPLFLRKLSIFSYFRAKIEAIQVWYDESIGLDQLIFDWSH